MGEEISLERIVGCHLLHLKASARTSQRVCQRLQLGSPDDWSLTYSGKAKAPSCSSMRGGGEGLGTALGCAYSHFGKKCLSFFLDKM